MNLKSSIIVLVLLTLGILIYLSPEDSHKMPNTSVAIETGRMYSYHLLNGNKKGLIKLSIEPAKTKIESLNSKQISISEMINQLKEKQIPIGIGAPFFSDQKDEDMELVAFEKMDNFIVMTFAFKALDEIVEIPEKGKMLFSIAIRFYKPQDDLLSRKLVRKIANLPVINPVAGELGTTGKWVVFNYDYKYNLNDYYDWSIKEGKSYVQAQFQEVRKFEEQMKNPNFINEFMNEIEESANEDLEFLYNWGELALVEQTSRIDKFYKIKEIDSHK